MILRGQNWREDRVWFHDVADRLCSLPANWTSTVAEDPFNVVAAGGAVFRVEGDIVILTNLNGICDRQCYALRARGEEKRRQETDGWSSG